MQEQCRNAQLARSKISKSLQVVQSAESDFKSKLANHASFQAKIGNGTGALLVSFVILSSSCSAQNSENHCDLRSLWAVLMSD